MRQEVDLVVIGSGLGGLCAGALAARYGLEVLVLEAHSVPGERPMDLAVKGSSLNLVPPFGLG